MYVTKFSRDLFLDSDTLTNAVSKQTRVLFPASHFHACCDDKIQLSLVQFTFPRRFHTVNSTNSIFYIRDSSNDTYTKVQIPHGSYKTFPLLADAVQRGMVAVGGILAGATCTFDTTTSRLS